MTDIRDEYISQVVDGCSFAEVGGLWGAVSEKVSVAYKHGASELAMFDRVPFGSPWWTKFEERRESLGLPDVRCVDGDLMRLVETRDETPYDVVHCSGVLYHMPNPLRLLTALKKLARQHVILTSVVVPSHIENEAGTIDMPEGSALFVAALEGRERAVIRQHWLKVVGDVGAIGVTLGEPKWDVEDFGPWWWMPTVPALEGMCRAAGFDVVESSPFWGGNARTLLLRVRSAEVVN